jgi:hypothetical protein
MLWLAASLVFVLAVSALSRKRRETVTVVPGEPISTLNTDLSKKHSKEKKRALDAATQLLH